jgi:SAM-dependent methyltransferase
MNSRMVNVGDQPPAPSSDLDESRRPPKYDSEEFARAQQVAHARLYPSIFASNYLVLRNRRIHMRQFFAGMKSVGKVLDVGAQYCPYYPLFKDKCESYTSLDLVDTPIVDVVCNAEQMKLADNSFDLVLCTQVLEHVQNPGRVVDECYRVLKPGGILIATAPSMYPQHGYPADNWRFMPDGFRYMLRSFSEVEVLGELDFAESLASANCFFGHVLTGRMGKFGNAINPLWHLATNVCGMALSFVLRPLSRSNFSSYTMNLWAQARK